MLGMTDIHPLWHPIPTQCGLGGRESDPEAVDRRNRFPNPILADTCIKIPAEFETSGFGK
jgi:hypothetical protein